MIAMDHMHEIGQHGLLDLHGVAPSLTMDDEVIKMHLLKSAELAGATVLQVHFHHFGQGHGVTGVILLSESHISIHTWPEYEFVAIDIFMCGQHKIEQAIEYLKQAFNPSHYTFNLHTRGT